MITLFCIRCKTPREYDVPDDTEFINVRSCGAPIRDRQGRQYSTCGGRAYGTHEWLNPVRWTVAYAGHTISSNWIYDTYEEALTQCKSFLSSTNDALLVKFYGKGIRQGVRPVRCIAWRMDDGRVNGDRIKFIHEGLETRTPDGAFATPEAVRDALEDKQVRRDT